MSGMVQADMATALAASLDVLRTATGNASLSLQYLLCFFHVAARRGSPCHINDIEQSLGLSRAAASRAVATLGRGMVGHKGFHLVDAQEDPSNRSAKLVTLTRKGTEVMERIAQALKEAALGWVIPEGLRPYLNLQQAQEVQQ